MKTIDYVILTPIAPHKLYSLDRFLNNIILFHSLPREIVFCAEPECVGEILKWEKILEERGIKLVVFTLEPEVLSKTEPARLERIKHSREHLRHYFISSQFQWALWLDSDIIPELNVTQVLMSVAQKEKVLAVTNAYPGRKDVPWHGIACTLTHKAACTLTRFEIGHILWEGEEKHLSEDFCFLAILDRGDSFIKKWTGWGSRKIGRFVSILHEIRPGVDKFLEKKETDH
jgi:hypothetical protein